MGFIPEELIAEILSYLSVKTILRLKCVSKSWNTLIWNPTFVKKHLNKSSQNPHVKLILYVSRNNDKYYTPNLSLAPFPPVCRLLENASIITIQNVTLHQLEIRFQVAGSCKGLICLVSDRLYATQYQYRCSFWNPSTRSTYEDLGVLSYDPRSYANCWSRRFMFTFGYDDSTRIYKIVAYRVEHEEEYIASGKSEVKVFSVGDIDGDNCWRNIPSFPVIPLDWQDNRYTRANHLNGTINWLAINEYFFSWYVYTHITHVEQFVIVSLDLSTETYKQLLLPQGFDEVPLVEPKLSVLMGCLCFSHDSRKTEFVLWQMKEYGVQESWTLLFKISKQNLQMHFPTLAFEPVCLYINGDTVIFANQFSKKLVMYNLRDQIGETIKITNAIDRPYRAMNYVESLV